MNGPFVCRPDVFICPDNLTLSLLQHSQSVWTVQNHQAPYRLCLHKPEFQELWDELPNANLDTNANKCKLVLWADHRALQVLSCFVFYFIDHANSVEQKHCCVGSTRTHTYQMSLQQQE